MRYSHKLLMGIALSFTFMQCSNNSTPERQDYIRTLDETPEHIQEVENLSVFPGDAEPAYSVELIPEQSFGETGEPHLTSILGAVIDDNGRLIILDQSKDSSAFPFLYNVHVFNSDGTYHTQIGEEGRGPGEYGVVLGVQAEAKKVFVFDYTSQRLNIYDTDDYSFERSTLIDRWSISGHEAARGLDPGYFEARSDGNFIIIFNERNLDTKRPVDTYLLMDTDGNALDFEPLEFPSSLNAVKGNSHTPSSLKPLPFMGKTITALSGEEALYSAWTQDFLIKKYDSEGNYQSAIYYPVAGSPFTLTEYTEQAEYNQRDVMNTLDEIDEELPESNPVIADMKIDDENRIWVAVPTGIQSETYEWWILKESGELLAKLMLPSDQSILDIKNGYLYSKKTNEETDTEFVVKYRIELTEK